MLIRTRLRAPHFLASVTVASLATASLVAGCGARTTLTIFDDGETPSLDAGRPRDVGPTGRDTGPIGIDAGPVRCTSDGECPDDGLMCNGFAYCNRATGLCEMAIPERCNDFVDCTTDRCVEGRGCVFEPDPRLCGDEERCDPMLGCVGGCTPTSPVETQCRDGLDDDCDGLPDCADPECRGTPACTMCSDFEFDCANRFDEDCDGLPDCADPDCAGNPACGTCTPTERVERSCFDGLDNDCNGLFDCGDFNCARDPGCGGCMPISDREIFCADGRDDDCDGLFDCGDMIDCAGSAECGGCEPVAMTEVTCNDGRDDDCDGAIDCADRDCTGVPSCGCVPISRSEGRCRDMRDDDCDGLVDCRDPDCAARPFCMSSCTPTAMNELGVDACTNGLDEDCDGRADCSDPDCSPFGPMGECCDGLDNNGDGNTDEFTCRCFAEADCVGVGTLDQTCWTGTFSVCAPRCNLYGGDRFCRDGFMLMSCDRTTGECL
jgi:hypothetical protein